MSEELDNAVVEEVASQEPAYEVEAGGPEVPEEPAVHEVRNTKSRGRPKGSKNREKPAEVEEEPATPDPPRNRKVTRMTTPRPPRVDTPEPINSHSIANAMLNILSNRNDFRRDQKRALYKSFLE